MLPRIENNIDVEGFGIVYLEANLFKKPIITTKSGGVADAVINQETGIIIEHNNCSDISRAIMELFSNPQLMGKLGEQGRIRVLNKFQWFKQISKLKNIL